MSASLPARLTLIAVLVLSQALYAGHGAKHDSGGQPDCQICLQTSAGGAALLPADGFTPSIGSCLPPHGCFHDFANPCSSLPNAHPSRAPPQYPA